MNTKSVFTSLSILFLCLPTVSYAENSLKGSWSKLLNEHSGLASQNKMVASENAQLANAKAKRYPSLALSSQWNSLDDEIGLWIDMSTIMPGGQPVYFPVQEQSYWDTELKLTLPLYTGGKITAGIQSERADVLQSQAIQQATEDKLFTTFVERYLKVELAEQKLSIRALALDNLQKHFDRALRMEEEGTIALTQRLQAQVERDKAKREWQQARVDAQLAFSSYQALFATDVPAPSQTLTYFNIKPFNTDQVISKVLARAPGLAQIKANEDKALAGLKAAKANFLPQIALFSQVELATNDLTQLDPEWAAGVAIQWSLFGNGNRLKNAQSYQYLAQAADLKSQQTRRDLSVLTQQTLLSIENARNAYVALESSQELAEENLRLQQKAFVQGINTSLDEIDAQLLVTGLKLESQKALFDYYTSLANLSALVGDIDSFFSLMSHVQSK